MFKSKNKIVDERQEFQEMKNAKLSYNILLLLLGFTILAQSVIYSSPVYYLPEAAVLLAACAVNIFLDIKHGLFYTNTMQNGKKKWALYLVSSLIAAFIIVGGNCLKFHFSPSIMLVLVPVVFCVFLGLMFIFDYCMLMASKKRLKKLNSAVSDDEESL